MRWVVFIAAVLSLGAIIDRIAIVVGNHPILDSAINQDIRITAFLNGVAPDFSPNSRKQAASRLIDQEIIRAQIRLGGYPIATEKEADELIAHVRKEDYPSEAQFRHALSQAGISFDELKDRLLWQMTVLRFIDARFRPAVVVSDQDIQRYYDSHRKELKESLEDERQTIVDRLTGERVNQLLEEWLKDERKRAGIEYLEKSLQ